MKNKIIMLAILTTVLAPLAIAADDSGASKKDAKSGIERITEEKVRLQNLRERLTAEGADKKEIDAVDEQIKKLDGRREALEQRVKDAKENKHKYLSTPKDGIQ